MDDPAAGQLHLVRPGPTPPRTGKRGRPALKGAKLPKPAALAAGVTWVRTKAHRYGHLETVDLAVIPAIWYGPFGNTGGQVVLVGDPGSTKVQDLALFTTDTDATDTTAAGEAITERYAVRWSIEPSNANGKQ